MLQIVLMIVITSMTRDFNKLNVYARCSVFKGKKVPTLKATITKVPHISKIIDSLRIISTSIIEYFERNIYISKRNFVFI